MTDQLTLNFAEPELRQVQVQPDGGPAKETEEQLRLISFELQADFGFFKKPDVNDGLQQSYNTLHKPALLGILGAIAGLSGYQQKGQWPDYYRKLQSVQIGIEPLNHERGNFTRTAIKYTNTVGYANKAEDGKSGANQIVHENTLRCPAYRIYVLLDEAEEVQSRLLARIQQGEAEFVPYLGKNEFTAWWESETVYMYEVNRRNPDESFNIRTLFTKDSIKVGQVIDDGSDRFDLFDFAPRQGTFLYFERLPIGFNETLRQYELRNFAFTDYPLKSSAPIEGLYRLNANNYVQLV